MSLYKLGKKEKKKDSRNLQAKTYLDSRIIDALPKPPMSRDWSKKLPDDTGFFLNDLLGTCAVATAGHIIQCLTANDGNMVTVADSDILKAYIDVGGYVIGHPETDNGCYALDVLKYWRNVGIGGHKILGFAEIDPNDHALMNTCLELFGNLYLGFSLPVSAQTQTIWDVTPSTQVWGGHAVNAEAFTPFIRLLRTWARKKQATIAFNDKHLDEAYVVLDTSWTGPDKVAPNGFLLDVLMQDLSKV